MFFTWTKQEQVACCLEHIFRIFFLFTLFSFLIIPQIFFFQHGRQDLVCWLVEKTRDRDRLSSNNGERCLLHVAARFGQVGWTILYQNQNIVSLSVQMVSYRKYHWSLHIIQCLRTSIFCLTLLVRGVTICRTFFKWLKGSGGPKFLYFSRFILNYQDINFLFGFSQFFGWSRRCRHIVPLHSSYIQNPRTIRGNAVYSMVKMKVKWVHCSVNLCYVSK